jgi:DNA-binding transcriptional MerR regulator
MHHFTIRDMENLSGIKAHTLRVWEQRYRLCLCKRKESLHRYYDNEDLKHILRIAYLYHNGYKISRIATLTPDAILQLTSHKSGKDEFDLFSNQLLESGMDFNQERFERVLDAAVLHSGMEKTVIKLVYPFMEKIGLLWLTNHIIPGQEHFCSHLVQKKLITAIDGLPPAHENKRRILLFAPEGEYHEIPLLLAQYLFKKNGHKTVYFGINAEISSLKHCCDHLPVTHLYFHLITNFTSRDADEYVQQLAAVFPGKKIIASGPALKTVKAELPDLQLLHSLKEMLELSRKL